MWEPIEKSTCHTAIPIIEYFGSVPHCTANSPVTATMIMLKSIVYLYVYVVILPLTAYVIAYYWAYYIVNQNGIIKKIVRKVQIYNYTTTTSYMKLLTSTGLFMQPIVQHIDIIIFAGDWR